MVIFNIEYIYFTIFSITFVYSVCNYYHFFFIAILHRIQTLRDRTNLKQVLDYPNIEV